MRAALLAAILLALPVSARAQEGSLSLGHPGPGQMMASAIGKVPVFDATGVQIGDAQGVVMTYDGRVAAVLIGIGGVLGILERPVAVLFEHVTLSETEDGSRRIDLDIPLDALDTAPDFRKP